MASYKVEKKDSEKCTILWQFQQSGAAKIPIQSVLFGQQVRVSPIKVKIRFLHSKIRAYYVRPIDMKKNEPELIQVCKRKTMTKKKKNEPELIDEMTKKEIESELIHVRNSDKLVLGERTVEVDTTNQSMMQVLVFISSVISELLGKNVAPNDPDVVRIVKSCFKAVHCDTFVLSVEFTFRQVCVCYEDVADSFWSN